MKVDIEVRTLIRRPREEVAAYAADPSMAPLWYRNISTVDWLTPPPLASGSRIAFVAHFLGRHMTYTYEVAELVPGERLVMTTAQGPFPMATTYTWTSVGNDTRMTLRNAGSPSGFGTLVAPVIARAMRRATTQDLTALRTILESAGFAG